MYSYQTVNAISNRIRTSMFLFLQPKPLVPTTSGNREWSKVDSPGNKGMPWG